MIKFAKKLLLFVVLFLVYDKLFIIMTHFSAEAEIDKRLEYLVNGQISKDVVIIGSSRGSRDIIAGQIEDETGLSAYNLCYPGSNVEFHDFILQTLIRFNEPPKIVFLMVDDNEEFRDGGARILFRRDRLYPLVKYQYIWKEMAHRGYLDNDLSSFIVLQRLNKYNFDLRQKRFTPIDTIFSCGSMPCSWQKEGVDWAYDSSERLYPVEKEVPEKVSTFQNMINSCNNNGIKLIILFPPNYRSPSQSFEDKIRQLSGENASFYHYNGENPIYKNRDYYYDKDHLKRDGATIYTNELIAFLNDFISQ